LKAELFLLLGSPAQRCALQSPSVSIFGRKSAKRSTNRDEQQLMFLDGCIDGKRVEICLRPNGERASAIKRE
jgi:hypothetical protein